MKTILLRWIGGLWLLQAQAQLAAADARFLDAHLEAGWPVLDKPAWRNHSRLRWNVLDAQLQE